MARPSSDANTSKSCHGSKQAAISEQKRQRHRIEPQVGTFCFRPLHTFFFSSLQMIVHLEPQDVLFLCSFSRVPLSNFSPGLNFKLITSTQFVCLFVLFILLYIPVPHAHLSATKSSSVAPVLRCCQPGLPVMPARKQRNQRLTGREGGGACVRVGEGVSPHGNCVFVSACESDKQ